MGFKVRDLLISVLPSAGNQPPQDGCIPCTGTTGQGQGGGCIPCTGTTGQGHGGGCIPCTGTTRPMAAMGACTECTYTYGAQPLQDFGCIPCTGTTGPGRTGNYGCNPCTGTTNALCAHAAALAACGACTGVSPAIGAQRPEALALLKQQLQGLIAEIEAEERRLEDAGFPQSAEEVELLEKKLEEALAEVRSRKAAASGKTKKKKG